MLRTYDAVPSAVTVPPCRPGAVIRPVRGEWHPQMPEHLDDEGLADWLGGHNGVYQLAALTIGARLAVVDG